MDKQKPTSDSGGNKIEIPLSSEETKTSVTIETAPTEIKKNKNRLRRSQILLGLGLILLTLLTVTAVGFLANQIKKLKQKAKLPSSYQECTEATGSKVQESYPAICVTKDGVRFLQPLTEEEQKKLNPLDETANWETFSNSQYKYSFKYPPSVEVGYGIPGNDMQTVEIEKGKSYSLSIGARNEYLAADVKYFLDTESDGQYQIGNIQWNHYSLPNGYGDGPDKTNPIYGYRVEYNNILYTIIFSSPSLTPLQSQILSTFKFTDITLIDCSNVGKGPELDYLTSYFIGSQCRFKTKEECEKADVVSLKNNKLSDESSQDGIADCVWYEENEPLNKCKNKYVCEEN